MVVLKQKVVTVTTSGTPVQVFTSAVANPGSVVGVMFQPHTVTSALYVGTSAVTSSAYALKLTAATQMVALPTNGNPIDLQSIYIDAATNGDKIAVLYLEKVSR